MTVKFIPTGTLDVNTDPSILPSSGTGKDEISGAMRRCKNLQLDTPGIARTRDGSKKVNGTALTAKNPLLLMEMSGDRYTFAGIDNTSTIYRNETSIVTGLANQDWRGIQYNAWNDTTLSIFALNGVDRKRIDGSNVNEWGIDAPTVAPTLNGIDYVYTSGSWEADEVTGVSVLFTTSVSAPYGTVMQIYPWEEYYDTDENEVVTITASNYGTFYFDNNSIGLVKVKYTYCRVSGGTLLHESNPSDATTISKNSGIKVTWTASSDSQVTHVRIYRSLPGFAVYYYDSQHAVGDLSVVLTTTDSALGSEVAIDNNRPPLGTVVLGPAYNGYCFILKDNLVYFSKLNRPESWPLTYFIEAGQRQRPLKAGVFFNNVLYVATQDELFMVQGTGFASFFPYPLKAKTGALSQESIISIRGKGIYRVATDGIYRYDGAEDKKITEEKFDQLFRGVTVNGVTGINTSYLSNSWLFAYKNMLYFGYPGIGSTLPNNILVMNLDTEKVTYYDYSRTFPAIEVDKTNDRILALDNAGFVWVLEDSSITTDAGTAISWEIESKSFTDRLRKYFPRYARYDITIGSGATATGTVLLDDTAIQTHTISESRKTKFRHIDGKNGDRLGIRVSGTGTVNIREVEVQ